MAFKDMKAFPLHPRRWQHRRPGHVLPFRVPFFRIFYSTTYTTLFILVLILLAITPAAMIWTAIENEAYQYIFMISGTYALTAIIVIFIYSSRIWTNRRALAEVGKAYIPVEDGELGRNVRKLVKRQLDISAIVAWESRPRDLEGEILRAEKEGLLPNNDTSTAGSASGGSYTVGTIINVDPAFPPWGNVAHDGWSSPSSQMENHNPHIQYANVVAELPNILEAKAVSLAPLDPLATPVELAEGSSGIADPVVVEVLRRPATMGMRDYITQLTYLGLVNPPNVGPDFLNHFESGRFSGRPVSKRLFDGTMAAFARLLEGMTGLAPEIVEQIHLQCSQDADHTIGFLDNASSHIPKGLASEKSGPTLDSDGGSIVRHTSSAMRSVGNSTSMRTPVTAQTAWSKSATASSSTHSLLGGRSEGSLNSVVIKTPPQHRATPAGSPPHEDDQKTQGLGISDTYSDDIEADTRQSGSEEGNRSISRSEKGVKERRSIDGDSRSILNRSSSSSLEASESGSVIIRNSKYRST